MVKLSKTNKNIRCDTFILLINKKFNLQARKTADGKGDLDVWVNHKTLVWLGHDREKGKERKEGREKRMRDGKRERGKEITLVCIKWSISSR